jgi:two-component system, chemotaxis family, chemotaxis protein CheY
MVLRLLCFVNKGEILQFEGAAAAQPRCPPGPCRRILVVDDDVLILHLNTAVLSRLGYQTETAEDGAAAWEALQTNRYDLLVTDNNMPRLSGVELVKKVRSARMTLPVILASGNLPTRELDQNAWLQPVATLAKPFTPAALLATVNKAFREAGVAPDQTEPVQTFSQGEFGRRAHLQPRLPSALLVH